MSYLLELLKGGAGAEGAGDSEAPSKVEGPSKSKPGHSSSVALALLAARRRERVPRPRLGGQALKEQTFRIGMNSSMSDGGRQLQVFSSF